MEDEQLQNHEDDARTRWIWLIAGLCYSFATLYSILSHGLRGWDWVQNASFALLFSSFLLMNAQERPAERSWRSRVFWLAYGSLFGAWIGHENGWIPGGCIILFSALAATERQRGWWSRGIKSPLGILELAVVAVGIGWFIATVKEWMIFACIGALILLLASEKAGRRSIREKLLHVKSIGWVGTFGSACYWSWREPSFASILVVIAIPVLWFGNLLTHLSSGQPLALSHPQS